ncbi:calmodulin, flagellar, partial [Exaiptasia diaphana]|uniref:EF-hand domain-containing protein n=1 Tax=Exaiptasia diaphana TaxID=2652724 RepID=A0A913Y0I7_EXADI
MSENLTETEIAAYKEAFSVFDKNDDGTVTVSELDTVMRTVGVNPSEEQLQEMINDADLDGNGCVDFTEFLHMMSKTKSDMEDNTEKEIYEAFCVFDKDDSGFITDEELRMVLESLGKE